MRRPNVPFTIAITFLVIFNLLIAAVPSNAALAIWGPGNVAENNPNSVNNSSPAPTVLTPAQQAALEKKVAESFGKLPLSFEANTSQLDGQVKYFARGSGYDFYLTASEAVLALRKPNSNPACSDKSKSCSATKAKPTKGIALAISFAGASPSATVTPSEPLPGQTNYFYGDDQSQWKTGVTNYGKITYKNIYSGIDLSYYGNQTQLEYDLVVAPGADPGLIRLKYRGADKLELTPKGELSLSSNTEKVANSTPFIYQLINGQKQVVLGSYQNRGSGEYGFKVENYDHTKPLVIDPILSYSTYVGSAGKKYAEAIAIDNSGNAYITGDTDDSSFPTTTGAYDISTNGNDDVFVTKLNNTGTGLVYSTFLGGSGADHGLGIAVDSSGNAYVTGDTASSGFPKTTGAFQATKSTGIDAFVTKLNSTGTALIYSTFLGGNNYDYAQAIALDSSNNAYVTGYTRSTTFPTTSGAYQTTKSSLDDAFVTKLNITGTALIYSTYLGKNANDVGYAITVDSSGNAYVAGETDSTNFAVTTGAYQTTAYGAGTSEAFITKLNSTGTSLSYSTYLGGNSGSDVINGIALDGSGKIYVAGQTFANDFPVTIGAYQTTFGGGDKDAFVAKLNPAGGGSSDLVYSTYLGGSADEYGEGIVVDSGGNAIIVGKTLSSNYPVTSGAYQTSLNSSSDAFITKLNSTGTGLSYSTYLGGDGEDGAKGVATDSVGNIYVAGQTTSTDYPVTSGGFSNGGVFDSFVSKLSLVSLEFSTQPSGGVTSTPFSQQPVVRVKNPDGSTQTGFTGAVTLVIKTGTGTSGASLNGTTTVNAVNGVATFSGLSISAPGSNYQLTASSNLLVPVDSNPFNISGSAQAATLEIVSGNNQNTAINTAFGNPLVVRVKDSSGALLSGVTVIFTAPITGTGLPGGTFVSGLPTYTGTTNASGLVTSTTFSANGQVGSYNVVATASGTSSHAAFYLTNTNNTAYTIQVVAGSNQNALLGTVYGSTLQAIVLDSGNNPVEGKEVTFNLPYGYGLGDIKATFAGGGTNAIAITKKGIAISPVFTATNNSGIFTATATIYGANSPAIYNLNNIIAQDNGGVAIKLDPITAGPNPLGITQTLTATVTRHGITPLASQNVNFEVRDSGGNLITSVTQNTNSSGVATFSYSSSITRTDTITASTAVYGKQVNSNNSIIYWGVTKKMVSTSSIYGRFFPRSSSVKGIFNTDPSTIPYFSQSFNSLIFNPDNLSVPGKPSDLNNFSRPFTNISIDTDGNYVGNIPAEGNGYQAGVRNTALESFDAVFTGQFVVTGAVTVTFGINHDDSFILGIGNGAQKISGPNVGAPISGVTAFQNLPIMGSVNEGLANVSSVVVRFPSAGIYPFELDYSQGDPYAFSLTLLADNERISPIGSLVLTSSTSQSLDVGLSQSFTVTATNPSGGPLAGAPVKLIIRGANTPTLTGNTDSSGVKTFSYTGVQAGEDTIQAVSWINGSVAYSSILTKTWLISSGITPGGTPPGGGEPGYNCQNQNWISSPANASTVSGIVNIALATGTPSLRNWKLLYYPVSDPTAVTVIITGTSVGLPTTPPSIDTTLLANGSYILQLQDTTNTTTECQVSRVLFTVVGENKPGRVTFTVTDFTVPLAGMPIVIGRTYDSLERTQKGDFSNGWKLAVGSPKVEVNPKGDVTLTLLDGRRVTYGFTPTPGPSIFGFLSIPAYTGEPGAYGTLTGNGCGLIASAGSSGGYACFPGGAYKPTSYTYRDPYGRVYNLNAPTTDSSGVQTPGTLQSLTDMNGNSLSFDATGVKYVGNDGSLTNSACPTGYLVCYGRDSLNNNRIITITDTRGIAYHYGYTNTYSPEGDLTSVTLPSTPTPITYSYYANHFFKEAFDPYGHSAVQTDYYLSGDSRHDRLKTVTQTVSTGVYNVTGYDYDLVNNITTVTNPDGGRNSYQYDNYGKTISETVDIRNLSTDPAKTRSTQSSYDAFHNLTQTVLPDPNTGLSNSITRTVKYEYNPQGHQTRVTSTLGYTSTTSYNPYGGPQTLTDQIGHSWQVGYDENFMPQTVTDTIGIAGGYSFNERGSVTTRSDGNAQVTSLGYDQYGNKTSETDPLGNTTRYQYDQMGRMTLMTDVLGVQSKYEYDDLGRVMTTTAAFGTPLAAQTKYTYDYNGNKTSETDPLTHTTRYTYDFANRVTKITYPDNTTQNYTYDWRGNKTNETFKDNGGTVKLSTSYQYDLAGQLVKTIYADHSATDTASVVVTYDLAGRKVKEYNAYNGSDAPSSGVYSTTYTYDDGDRLITVKNQLGQPTSYTYDKAGRTTNITDANGRVMTYTYDIRGRQTQTTWPTLNDNTVLSTTQSYNSAGNLDTKTDQEGKTTTYSYDRLNRLLSVSIPITGLLNQTTRYQYDQLGRIKSIQDANLNLTSFVYDGLGRQVKKFWPDNSYEQMDYDLNGFMTSHRLTDGTTNTYTPDNMNRLSQVNYGFGGRVITTTYTATGQRYQVLDTDPNRGPTTYQYDGRDRVINISQPGNLSVAYKWDANNQRTLMTTTAGSVSKTTSYTYDPVLRLNTVTGADDPIGKTNTYTYDPVGLRTQLVLANGITNTYQYDEANRLKGITQTNNSGTLASYTYTLDKVGNKKTLTEGSGRNVSWTYDDGYRLVKEVDSASPVITSSFEYDLTGNRTRLTAGSVVTTSTYNELDQLTRTTSGSTTTQYKYDGRGNLTQAGSSTTYTWDAMDRLTSATVPGGSATYTYDAAGHRMKQVAGSTTTNYLWDELSQYGDVVLETDAANTIQTSYTLGNTELLSQKRGTNPVEYFLTDGHSGIRNLTNNTGSISESYKYDAFGNLQGFSGTPNSKYLYTGQQFDALTGLYDLRARYYTPGQGRFLSPDKNTFNINDPIELNRFNYVANNAVNYNDPSGFSLELATIQKAITKFAVKAITLYFTNPTYRLIVKITLAFGAFYFRNFLFSPYGGTGDSLQRISIDGRFQDHIFIGEINNGVGGYHHREGGKDVRNRSIRAVNVPGHQPWEVYKSSVQYSMDGGFTWIMASDGPKSFFPDELSATQVMQSIAEALADALDPQNLSASHDANNRTLTGYSKTFRMRVFMKYEQGPPNWRLITAYPLDRTQF